MVSEPNRINTIRFDHLFGKIQAIFCSCDKLLGKILLDRFLICRVKSSLKSFLVFISKHFLALVLIFGLQIVLGFGLLRLFDRSLISRKPASLSGSIGLIGKVLSGTCLVRSGFVPGLALSLPYPSLTRSLCPTCVLAFVPELVFGFVLGPALSRPDPILVPG